MYTRKAVKPSCCIMKKLLLLTVGLFLLLSRPEAQPSGDGPERYLALISRIAARPDDSTAIDLAYNLLLKFQNATIDRNIMLRQRLQYADAETLRLFKKRDSLLLTAGRTYEQPVALRPDTQRPLEEAQALEEQILTRMLRSDSYFMALSVKFSKAAYDDQPTLKRLVCYRKIAGQKGDSELAAQLRTYSEKKQHRPLDWREILRELSPYEASVEFTLHRDEHTQQVHYGALVLRKGFRFPRYVALCTQAELDEVLQKNGLEEAIYYRYLYEPLTGEAPAPLYDLIWKPLINILKNIKKIYYAPAGDIHRLNPGAICTAGASHLLQDQYEFVRINSTRSLISTYSYAGSAALPDVYLPCASKTPESRELVSRFFGSIEVDFYDPEVFSHGKTAALFGNISYDMDSVALRQPASKSVKSAVSSASAKGIKKRQFIKGATEWEALEGTAPEIGAIADILSRSDYKVRSFERYAASEECFRKLGRDDPSPRIIHVATHGFFLQDTLAQRNDHPMNRSGLIFAGANYAWKAGKPLKQMEDGILTAFEISCMNLQNTELVVLSACETGLGYLVANEGVFGLQRAFKQAGVKNLLVSLWSVPDQATRLLMEQFYQNCLEHDTSMRTALRAAQQWMRQQEAYKNPYFWAGFVLLE